MKINIYSPDINTNTINGFTIVVDVLRAFSVSYFINANNPKKYIVVDSIEQAFELKNKIKNSILIGERQGIKIEGFDFGNSPTEIIDKDFNNKIIIHTTTAGTKGLLAQKPENLVVAGSFVNAAALVEYIQKNNIEIINIYCTAPKGTVFGEEDYYFAEYLKSVLLGKSVDFDNIFKILKQGTGVGFSEKGFAPYSDFAYCMELNKFNKILKREIIKNENYKIELIEL